MIESNKIMAKQLLTVKISTEEVAMAWKFHVNATVPETNLASYG